MYRTDIIMIHAKFCLHYDSNTDCELVMGIWPIPVFGLFESVATDNMDPWSMQDKTENSLLNF